MDVSDMADRLRDTREFWYLASPYSKYTLGIQNAYEEVCKQAALLLKAGVLVFSPIAHSHPISVYGQIDAGDHELWLRVDAPLLHAAKGAIILKMDGWENSFGIGVELKMIREAAKPIVYMTPGVVPEELG